MSPTVYLFCFYNIFAEMIGFKVNLIYHINNGKNENTADIIFRSGRRVCMYWSGYEFWTNSSCAKLSSVKIFSFPVWLRLKYLDKLGVEHLLPWRLRQSNPAHIRNNLSLKEKIHSITLTIKRRYNKKTIKYMQLSESLGKWTQENYCRSNRCIL